MVEPNKFEGSTIKQEIDNLNDIKKKFQKIIPSFIICPSIKDLKDQDAITYLYESGFIDVLNSLSQNFRDEFANNWNAYQEQGTVTKDEWKNLNAWSACTLSDIQIIIRTVTEQPSTEFAEPKK